MIEDLTPWILTAIFVSVLLFGINKVSDIEKYRARMSCIEFSKSAEACK